MNTWLLGVIGLGRNFDKCDFWNIDVSFQDIFTKTEEDVYAKKICLAILEVPKHKIIPVHWINEMLIFFIWVKCDVIYTPQNKLW